MPTVTYNAPIGAFLGASIGAAAAAIQQTDPFEATLTGVGIGTGLGCLRTTTVMKSVLSGATAYCSARTLLELITPERVRRFMEDHPTITGTAFATFSLSEAIRAAGAWSTVSKQVRAFTLSYPAFFVNAGVAGLSARLAQQAFNDGDAEQLLLGCAGFLASTFLNSWHFFGRDPVHNAATFPPQASSHH